MESYYVGAYWLGRQEPVETCARRAKAFFDQLARCDSVFAAWYEKAGTRDEALRRPVNLESGALATAMRGKEQARKEGLVWGAWTGHEEGQGAAVRFVCGSSSPVTSSSCVLNPPHEGATAERVLSASVLAQVLRAAALAWAPEWGIATSHSHRDEVLRASRAGTFVGWVMYFSRRRGPVPPLPAPVRVEPVEDLGTLVTLTPERFTASNPAHLALASQVHTLLDAAGLLHPLKPWDT